MDGNENETPRGGMKLGWNKGRDWGKIGVWVDKNEIRMVKNAKMAKNFGQFLEKNFIFRILYGKYRFLV